jgi:hypothetical protein
MPVSTKYHMPSLNDLLVNSFKLKHKYKLDLSRPSYCSFTLCKQNTM